MIVIPASLRSDFIHIAGMTIHIALESTIHIVGIRKLSVGFENLTSRIGIWKLDQRSQSQKRRKIHITIFLSSSRNFGSTIIAGAQFFKE